MKKIFPTLLLLLLGAITFQSCTSSKKLSTTSAVLRLAPKKGSAYDMDMIIKTKIEGMPGADMGIDMTTKSDFIVESVDAKGNFVYSSKTIHVTTKMDNPMMNVDYDSDKPNLDNPGEAAFHENIKGLLNIPFVSKLDKLGNVLEAPKPKNPDVKITEQQLQTVNQSQNSFINYPEKAVKVGDQWTHSQDINGQMPMTVTTNYTVKSITPTSVTLGLDGKIKLQEGGMGTGSGILIGETTVDRITGMIQKQNLTQKITMTVMGNDMKTSTNIDLVVTKK